MTADTARFSPRTANDFCGFWLGALSLTPYRYWQHTHNAHHATSGNLDRRGLGDVTMLTRREYEALPSSQKRAYRLARHPLVLLGIGPFLLFWIKHRFPGICPANTKRNGRASWRQTESCWRLSCWAHVSIGIGRAVVVPTLWALRTWRVFSSFTCSTSSSTGTG